MSLRVSYLLPVDNKDSPLLVNRSDIPGFKPTIYERFCAGFGVSQVSIHEAWPAHANLSSFAWFKDRMAKLID